MSTEAISLPVVAGGVGAGVAATSLQAKKTIVVSDLVGTINIEAKIGSAGWCQIASFSGPTLDKVITYMADELRVNAENGDAATVYVIAERTSSQSVDIPVPPNNGPGADVDATMLGCLITIEATGFNGNGSVNVEASGDGVNYSVIASFQRGGCKTVATSAKFLRAVGNGASATLAASAEDPAVTGTLTHIVFRPGATGLNAPGGNVYTDWQSAYDAARAAAAFGNVMFEFDARFSPTVNGFGIASCQIPAGSWDFDGFVVCGRPFDVVSVSLPVPATIDILDGADIANFARTGGEGPVVITYDGATPGPVQPAGLYLGTNTILTNSDPAAGPMIVYDGSIPGNRLIVSDPRNHEGGIGSWFFPGPNPGGAAPSPGAPVIDVNGNFTSFQIGGGQLANDIFRNSGGPVSIIVSFGSYTNPNIGADFNFQQPTAVADGATVIGVNTESHHRMILQPTLLPANSPFTAVAYASIYPVDTTGNVVEITLPPGGPIQGEIVTVKDVGGNASGNNITVETPAGETFENGLTAEVINTDYGVARFVSTGSGWLRL